MKEDRLEKMKKKALKKILKIQKAQREAQERYEKYLKDEEEKERLIKEIMENQYDASLEYYLKETGEQLTTKDLVELEEEIMSYLSGRTLITIKKIYEAWDNKKNDYLVGLIADTINEWYGEEEDEDEEYEEDEG